MFSNLAARACVRSSAAGAACGRSTWTLDCNARGDQGTRQREIWGEATGLMVQIEALRCLSSSPCGAAVSAKD